MRMTLEIHLAQCLAYEKPSINVGGAALRLFRGLCLKKQCLPKCVFIRWVGLVRKGFFESRDRFCWEQGLETRCKAPTCRPTHSCTGIHGCAGGAFEDAGVGGSCRLGKKTGQDQLWLGLQKGVKMQ